MCESDYPNRIEDVSRIYRRSNIVAFADKYVTISAKGVIRQNFTGSLASGDVFTGLFFIHI